MDLLQRWVLLIILAIINAKVFNIDDWQFWVICFGIGIVCSPLFKKEKE